jgi:hypothetical protein
MIPSPTLVRFAIVSLIILPRATYANCVPPWQTLFACDIPLTEGRAEFCELADPAAHKGKHAYYYSYSVSTEPAELHFETDDSYFSTKDTSADHPTDLTMGIGLVNTDYVYSFFVTEDKRLAGEIREASVRVYRSKEAFSSETLNNEVQRLQCKGDSIIANKADIRP